MLGSKAAAALAAAVILACPAHAAAQSPAEVAQMLIVRSLDGSGNNLGHLDWGKAGVPYLRVAPASYADGIARPVAGPPTRYVSNHVFNDIHQNLFSENAVTQWGFVWGQFLDHTFGLRQGAGGE